MTVLARILTVVGLGVAAYLIFFGKPREVVKVVMETPAEPQVEKQVQPLKRP